jgi:hypothetical protein
VGVLGTVTVVCAACAFAPGAALAGTLDQQQTATTGSSAIDNTISLGQTFTAGLSGGLDRVDLDMAHEISSAPLALTAEIRNVSGGAPGSTVLASQSVPAASFTGSLAFVPFTFATPAPVVAGTQYAIVAYTSGSGGIDEWGGAATGSYAGGATWSNPNSPPSGSWSGPGGGDRAFKTYVVTAAPSNAFTFSLRGKKLTVTVSAPGTVDVKAKTKKSKRLLKPSSASGGPGAITVRLALTKAAKRILKQKGKLKLRAKITFTPKGGSAASQTATLKLKRKKK